MPSFIQIQDNGYVVSCCSIAHNVAGYFKSNEHNFIHHLGFMNLKLVSKQCFAMHVFLFSTGNSVRQLEVLMLAMTVCSSVYCAPHVCTCVNKTSFSHLNMNCNHCIWSIITVHLFFLTMIYCMWCFRQSFSAMLEHCTFHYVLRLGCHQDLQNCRCRHVIWIMVEKHDIWSQLVALRLNADYASYY